MKPPIVTAHRKRWPAKVRKAVWEKFNRACPTCKQPTDERGFELDHLIPLELGGEDAIPNLRPICTPCHRIKTKADVAKIAKAKRREAKHRGFKAPPKVAMPARPKLEAPPKPGKIAKDSLPPLPRPSLYR
jgi:5-methylcytosine-specific restriction enzyme A